jgi:DNA invertase Pin-like site-specific DNA recombinase
MRSSVGLTDVRMPARLPQGSPTLKSAAEADGPFAIDTTTPTGKLMFQVTGAFAEFEHSVIRQRVHAGLKRAVEAGKQLGRPKIDPALERRIKSQLRAGKGILKAAAECGVGSGTVQRICARWQALSAAQAWPHNPKRLTPAGSRMPQT